MTKIIRGNRITVHYKCCECGAKFKEPLKELTNMTFLCEKCNEMENYMDVVGISIKEPKIKKNIKLKKECFNCHTFDKSLHPWQRCKCAVSWSCPGLNWSEKKKQLAIQSHKKVKGKSK